jgi:hypothetical protein
MRRRRRFLKRRYHFAISTRSVGLTRFAVRGVKTEEVVVGTSR